ncbi:MAG: calcium-binding protein, partial [Rickettsiales bacterium]
ATDVITDFYAGADQINLEAFTSITGFGDLTLSDSSGDAVVGLGSGQEIHLTGVDYTTLSVSDFTFAGQTLTGTASAETLTGGDGNDTIDGGDGDDTIIGGGGNDSMTGGYGYDRFVFVRQDGATDIITDFYAGADDIDLTDASFSSIENFADLSLADDSGDTVISFSGGHTIRLAGVSSSALNAGDFYFGSGTGESLTGSASADTLIGGNDGDEIYGLAGNDLLQGGLEDDTIDGGDGNDTLTGGYGYDDFYFAPEASATDVITDFYVGADQINLEAFTYITSFSGDLSLSDASGDAVIDLGGSQEIHLTGVDYTTLSLSDFILYGQTITGTASADTLGGGDGNDTLSGGAGDDELYGGAGNDTYITGTGDDYIEGGAGNDIFRYTTVSDSSSADGVDYIGDFAQGYDLIDVSALGYVDVSQFGVYNDGSYTEYYDTVTGFAVGFDGDYTFTNTDFIFAEQSVITGTGSADSINGTSYADQINGLGGGDTIQAAGEADTIDGGAGDDNLYGEAGNDVIISGEGDDYIEGGAGDDIFRYTAVSDSSNTDGVDYIGDFTHSEDLLDVSALGYTDVSDFTVYNDSGYTEIYDASGDFAVGFDGDY